MLVLAAPCFGSATETGIVAIEQDESKLSENLLSLRNLLKEDLSERDLSQRLLPRENESPLLEAIAEERNGLAEIMNLVLHVTA
jgi:hypothetical protein